MVVVPPQESGGLKVFRSVVSTSQPPEKENWLIQLFHASSMSCWEAHSVMLRSPGQETERMGAVGTVKVAEHEAVWPQASLASNETVTAPPQKGGAAMVVRSVLVVRHPPLWEKLASQLTKALSTWS